jgi:hypothetical protein
MQMPLSTALKHFTESFAAGAGNLGNVELRAREAIVEPYPLGAILKEYFGRLCMSAKPHVGGALHLKLFPLDVLELVQHGWRWVRDQHGVYSDNPHWNQHWVVIADRDGDAIFVDDTTAEGTVFGSIMQRNFKISDSLASFLEAMAEAMRLEAATYHYEVYDDDFNPLPHFLDDISAIARRVLGTDGEAGFMKFFFG